MPQAERLSRCVQVRFSSSTSRYRSGSQHCVLPVDENVLLHVVWPVSQTLTGHWLVVVALIPQHSTQTKRNCWLLKNSRQTAVNTATRNNTVPRGFVEFLCGWFFKPLHIEVTVTEGSSLFFSCSPSHRWSGVWFKVINAISLPLPDLPDSPGSKQWQALFSNIYTTMMMYTHNINNKLKRIK